MVDFESMLYCNTRIIVRDSTAKVFFFFLQNITIYEVKVTYIYHHIAIIVRLQTIFDFSFSREPLHRMQHVTNFSNDKTDIFSPLSTVWM